MQHRPNIAPAARFDYVNAAAWQPRRVSSGGGADGWTLDTLAAELERRGLRTIRKRNGDVWAQCPAPEHDDHNPSCQLREGADGRVLVRCQSHPGGWTAEARASVLRAIGPAPDWRPHSPVVGFGHWTDCTCTTCTVTIDGRIADGAMREPDALAIATLHRLIRPTVRRVGVLLDTAPTRREREREGERLRRAAARGEFPSADEIASARIPFSAPHAPTSGRSTSSAYACTAAFVSLGDNSTAEVDAVVRAPKRMGAVQRAVLADIAAAVNARLERGEDRALPYSSRKAGDRLGIDHRSIRLALDALVKHGAIERVGELPRYDNRPNGIPLYALRCVPVRCPLCASGGERASRVAGLDLHSGGAAGDRQRVVKPRGEQANIAPVALAQVERGSSSRLAAAEGGALPEVGGPVHAPQPTHGQDGRQPSHAEGVLALGLA